MFMLICIKNVFKTNEMKKAHFISKIIAVIMMAGATINCYSQSVMSFTTNDPVSLSVSIVSDSATCIGCSDGSATLTVGGGSSPYSYLWSNGATTDSLSGLVADTYTVTVTDSSSCTAIDTVIIAEPAGCNLSFASTITNISCYGGGADGSVALTVSGGTTPYSYAW